MSGVTKPKKTYAFGSSIPTFRAHQPKTLPGSSTEITVGGGDLTTTQKTVVAAERALATFSEQTASPRTPPSHLNFLTAPTQASKAKQKKPVRPPETADSKEDPIPPPILRSGSRQPPKEQVSAPILINGKGKSSPDTQSPITTPRERSPHSTLRQPFTSFPGVPAEEASPPIVMSGKKKSSPDSTLRQPSTDERKFSEPAALPRVPPIELLSLRAPVLPVPDLELTGESLKAFFPNHTLGTAKEFHELVVSERIIAGAKSLSLVEIDLSDDQFVAIITKFPHLSQVTLIGLKIGNASVKALKALKNLKSLTIQSCRRILPSTIEPSILGQLERLILSTESLIPSSFIAHLAENEKMEKLKFDGCPLLYPQDLALFNQAKSSKLVLTIKGCPLISPETFERINQGREHPIKIKSGQEKSAPSPNFRDVDFTAFGSAGEMMRKMLTGTGEDAPFMETPQLMMAPQMVDEAPEPFSGQFLDAETINSLFPHKRALPMPSGSIDRPTPSQILASEEELMALSIEGIENVRELRLFSSLSNTQLQAIFAICPLLERVILTGCPNLTDEVMGCLTQLRFLKEIEIRHCDQITQRGLQQLPLDRVQKFALSTDQKIEETSIFRKLLANRDLQNLELEFCPELNPTSLLLLTEKKEPFILKLRGCDQILKKHTDAFKEPMILDITPDEQLDFESFDLSGITLSPLSRKLCIPPPILTKGEIASRATFALEKLPSIEEELTFPHHEVIKNHSFPPFAGCDLTGSFSRKGEANQVLEIFRTGPFRTMREVRIWDHPDSPLSRFDHPLTCLGPLRSLLDLTTLYLGKLPGVRQRELELLFLKHPDEASTWGELTTLHLSALPISDEVLRCLSHLPKLKTVTLANTESFTFQGLSDLMNSRSLEKLVLVDCHSIDPFAVEDLLQKKKIIIDAELAHDPSIAKMAKQEALETENQLTDTFFWPLLKNREVDEALAREFYSPKLKRIGIAFTIDPAVEWLRQLKRYDRTILAYINIHRCSWSIIKEMIRVGFFTNQERNEPAPKTVQELLEYIDPKYERPRSKQQTPPKPLLLDEMIKPKIPPLTANERRRQVKDFDFRDLNLTHIPRFIKECGYWEGIQQAIKIEGNPHLNLESVASLQECCPFTFEKREELVLKNYSGVTAKMIEKLLTTPKGWPELQSVNFEEVPMRDKAFIALGALSIQHVRLARCHSFSFLGLKYLMISDTELKTVRLEECPTIDPFAMEALNKERTQRGLEEVQAPVPIPHDPSVLQMALEEAQFLLQKEENWHSYARAEWDDHSQTDQWNAFYQERLKQIGHLFTPHSKNGTELSMPISYYWTEAELILQSYTNISRAGWAIWQELLVSGISEHRFPGTIGGLLSLLDTEIKGKCHDNGKAMTYGDQLKNPNLDGLNLTRIPRFFNERFLSSETV